jgi:hypothetical protein
MCLENSFKKSREDMDMKNIMLLACVAVLGILLAGVGQAVSLRAAVDNTCVPDPGSIVVPSGKTATNFALQGLSAGVNCYTGVAIKDKGWFIALGDADGTRAYEYSYYVDQYGEGKKDEPYGPLSALSLNPGNYVVYVDGGKGAFVSADYDLI